MKVKHRYVLGCIAEMLSSMAGGSALAASPVVGNIANPCASIKISAKNLKANARFSCVFYPTRKFVKVLPTFGKATPDEYSMASWAAVKGYINDVIKKQQKPDRQQNGSELVIEVGANSCVRMTDDVAKYLGAKYPNFDSANLDKSFVAEVSSKMMPISCSGGGLSSESKKSGFLHRGMVVK